MHGIPQDVLCCLFASQQDRGMPARLAAVSASCCVVSDLLQALLQLLGCRKVFHGNYIGYKKLPAVRVTSALLRQQQQQQQHLRMPLLVAGFMPWQ